jgi:hypothetical protein
MRNDGSSLKENSAGYTERKSAAMISYKPKCEINMISMQRRSHILIGDLQRLRTTVIVLRRIDIRLLKSGDGRRIYQKKSNPKSSPKHQSEAREAKAPLLDIRVHWWTCNKYEDKRNR